MTDEEIAAGRQRDEAERYLFYEVANRRDEGDDDGAQKEKGRGLKTTLRKTLRHWLKRK
jgi:hypothetical protein